MSAPLLDIAGLSVHFGAVQTLHNVGLSLGRGDVVGVVGESGSGKTLLARAIIGLLPAGASASAHRFLYAGKDLQNLPADEWCNLRGSDIGLVLQEPLTALNPALRIQDQLVEPLRLRRQMTARQARDEAAAALESVRIPDPLAALRRYPHEFSGGQRQRMLIAGVMLLRPSLIIADEPSTNLDAIVGEEVLDVLFAQARSAGTAVILISHDLAQVARRAKSLIIMERGCIVESGRAEQVMLDPKHPYTRRLLDSIPQPREDPDAAPTGRLLVSASQLSIAYGRAPWLLRRRQRVQALADASFEVRSGETVAVIGESGSGKSSLGMATLGLLQPSGGEILIDGRSWAERSAAEQRALRQRVQVVFQDPNASLDPRMRVRQILAEPIRSHPLPDGERRARIHAALEEVGLDPAFAARFPHQMSGGQRQRVAIARALICNPELVVADEPVSSLDVTVQAQILRLLADLKQRRAFALLFITHDLAVVEHIADRVVVLRAGRIVEQGPRSLIFQEPRHEYTRRLLSICPRLVRSGDGYRLVTRELGVEA